MPIDPDKPQLTVAKKPVLAKPREAVMKPSLIPSAPSKRAVKIAAIGAVALAVGYLTWPSGNTSADEVAAAGGVARLAALDLAVAFPDGWHLGAAPATAASPHARTAVVVRGAASNPDQQAFVAELPLAGPLADARASDARLLEVAHDAEQGAATHLGAAHATYYSEGCTKLGTHAAKCRGTSTAGDQSRTIVTHVRLGESRAIVALFVSRQTPNDKDVDAIAASMKL